ncbi:hypothetical protein [Bartonella apis]|uniref:hypothetical protein n=1 Tax=Bartonella apis TaxID=1686310 RepID=UPI002430A8A1|nr:hypothetical protein [Bartonella apis]
MRDDYQSGFEDMDYQDPYNQQPAQPQTQLDPAVERVRRKLMRLMIVSIAITIILILIILAAVIYKVTSSSSDKTPAEVTKTEANPVPVAEPANNAASDAKAPAPAVPEFIKRSIALPQGTRILSQSLSNDMIALETLTPEGNTELVIYDYRKGHLVAGITVDTSPVAKQPVEEPVATPAQ